MTPASGVLDMCLAGDTRSAELAETLAWSLSREIGLPFRGIRGRPFFSLDSSRNHAPVRVLLEIGDNIQDRAFWRIRRDASASQRPLQPK